MPTLEVIATGFNVKKLDPEAYGITQRVCTMKVKLGDVEKTSTELRGLDGQWEEDQNKFTFEVSDPEKEQLEAWFIMGGVTLGVVATFNLNNLKKNVGTYKGFAPPGGKVDLSLKALDFGKEDVEEEQDESWMDMCGGEGGGEEDEC
jgi:hypothetical protein|uniref:C2 domain-containing protein n=1 Tax=Eutreptiella gymnastica TaxID=73025 RepID=A0A7S4CBW4_9EUGL